MRKKPLPMRTTVRIVLMLCMATVSIGCGSDDDDGQMNVVATQTPTATAPPTATPTVEEEGPELHFGATARGGGSLALQNDDDLNVKVFFSACLGGSGPTCDGGEVVYIASAPGFPAIEEDDPAQPLYTLNDDTQVDLLVKSIDPGVSLAFGGDTLAAADQSAVLGTTPGLHADGSWQLVAPGGAVPADHRVTLQLTTPSSAYAASAPFTIILKPTSGEPTE